MHKSTISSYWPIVDGHMDTISIMYESDLDFSRRQTQTHSDLVRLLEAGIGLQVLALFTRPNSNKSVSLQKILSYLEYIHGIADGEPRLQIVKTTADLPGKTPEPDNLRALLAVEGGDCLGGELWVLRLLYRLGVRLLTLTWSNRNQLADGVWEADSKGGLTRFGREVVQEMGKLGMVVDVSHLSPAGFWDVAKHVSDPFVASHSNAVELCNHPRNLTDEQIKCIADHGGVIGVCFCGPHLAESGRANLDHVIAHIEYLWRVAGEEHVGLGTDYDGINETPEGLKDVTYLPKLLEALAARGYSHTRLEKFAGANFLRVFQEVLPSD
ncbi:MAG: membrane dipeptidase [Firmicutes bacterium]|nr:membrane dipeptidase [Bacillota bacterium]